MHYLWPAESMLAVQRANTGRVARRITPAIGRRGAITWSVNGKPTTLLDTEVQDSVVDSGPSATPNRPDLRHIDSKWQQGWVEHEWKIRDRARRVPRLDALSAPRIPFYPYHEAFMRTQVICDVLVRFKRMQGFYVLHPMGWDPFKTPEDFSRVHPCWPNQSDPDEEKRFSVLRMITALRALNGSSGRQRRLHSGGNPFSIDPATTKECAFKAETVVIDPEYLPSNVLQKNSKTDDLSALLPGYNYHGLVGADVVRVSLLFQGLVGENNESNTRNFDSIRFWFGQIQTLVHDMYAHHSRWKYRLLHSTPRAESAQRSTWIKDELLQSRIDPTLYSEIQRTVRSVTASLGQTFEFHVAISDLFGLAKLLTDTAIRETRCYGIGVLLKLIAPIAPAFAEECWEELHWLGGWGDVTTIIQDNITRRQLADAHKGSIFRQDYPIPADILPLSDNHVQRCVVLEDGVLRFVAVIPIPCEDFTENMDATKLRLWVLEHVQKTKEWKEFARKVLVKLKRRVVVAKGARTVNLIPWGACDEIRETSASSGVLDIWSYLRPTWTG